MLTGQNTRELIQFPKVTINKTPANGYRETNGHKRCDLTLTGEFDTDAIPKASDILLALIPWAWEMINRHMPRNVQDNEGVDDRPWREWATAEA